MPEEYWANALFSLTPTVLVGLIFWFTMRGIFRADRTERKAYAAIEAEERARMGMPAADAAARVVAPVAAPVAAPVEAPLVAVGAVPVASSSADTPD